MPWPKRWNAGVAEQNCTGTLCDQRSCAKFSRANAKQVFIRGGKTGISTHGVAIIFQEFCPHHSKNRPS